jgi:hypothetical protein
MALALAVVALAEIDRGNPFAVGGALIDAAFAPSTSFARALSDSTFPLRGCSEGAGPKESEGSSMIRIEDLRWRRVS